MPVGHSEEKQWINGKKQCTFGVVYFMLRIMCQYITDYTMVATRPGNDEKFPFYIPQKFLYKPETVLDWISAHHIKQRWHINCPETSWKQMIHHKLDVFEFSDNPKYLNMVECIGHQVPTSSHNNDDPSQWRVVLNSSTFLDVLGHRDPNPLHYW